MFASREIKPFDDMENTYTRQQIKDMAQPLFDAMAQRVTREELERMQQAFELACEAHRHQKRKTGEPYIIHPIAVARIVGEEMQLGANPVCAAFLHDVVEDTSYTIEDMERLFGKDVASLVKVVTKQKKERYEMSKQVDNFRQMLNSIHDDIRALLIKLADRLHNMRTLSSMRPDKQMKIAGETDFFYAPLANRLGLYRIKIELENLSFKYRCPQEYMRLEKMLLDDRLDSKPVLDDFVARIDRQLKEYGIEARLEVKYRQPVSVRRKMMKTGTDFYHVENRHFVRIVFDENRTNGLTEKGMSLKIYEAITNEFKEKPGSVLNYIDAPKDNGYQSLHVKLLTCVGKWEEVHISSTRMRRVSTLGCMAERDDGGIRRWIEKLKSTLRDIAAHDREINFMEGVVSSFYNDDIRVFTPKGDPVQMPQKSTALDFAFEIHNKVGLHAQYARINGKLCSVKTPLHRGDCIEIGINEQKHPQPDWIDHVVTYKAKRALNAFRLQKKKETLHRCSHCRPIPGDEVIGFKNADSSIDVHRRDCRRAISRASQEGDSVVAVDYQADTDTLYPVNIHIKAVDRFHLLIDVIDCITNQLKLSMSNLKMVTEDDIVDCDICIWVHSFSELQSIITRINDIESVDEVCKQEAVMDD